MARPRSSAWHYLSLFALLVSFLVNTVAYGALARVPVVGQGAREAAHTSSPLANFYIWLGEYVAQVPVLAGMGESLVQSAWSPLFDRAREAPALTLDLVRGESQNFTQTLLNFNYWATPVLVLVWGYFWMQRPRSVHLVKSSRR